jgi:hypothetical protein
MFKNLSHDSKIGLIVFFTFVILFFVGAIFSPPPAYHKCLNFAKTANELLNCNTLK